MVVYDDFASELFPLVPSQCLLYTRKNTRCNCTLFEFGIEVYHLDIVVNCKTKKLSQIREFSRSCEGIA